MIHQLFPGLLLAKQKKIITGIKEIMDSLKNEAGFWIGKTLYDKVLQKAYEK